MIAMILSRQFKPVQRSATHLIKEIIVIIVTEIMEQSDLLLNNLTIPSNPRCYLQGLSTRCIQQEVTERALAMCNWPLKVTIS